MNVRSTIQVSSARRFVGGLLLLAAVALALRLYRLGAYSLWLDECIQYYVAALPLKQAFRALPPDWLIVPVLLTKLQIATNLAAREWLLRLPSVLFGTATVLTIFSLAHALFDRRVAWLSAGLAAIWPRLIEYSQEMRPYALFALLAGLAGLALLRAVRTSDTRDWLLFVTAATLELYVHQLAALNLLSFFLFVLADLGLNGRARRSAYALRAITAFGAIGIGFLSVLPFYLNSAAHYENRHALALNLGTFNVIFGSYLGLGTGPIALVLLLFVALGLVFAWGQHRQAAILALTWICVPFVFASLHKGGERFFASPRYVLFCLPIMLPFVAAGALVAGEGLAKLVWRRSETANFARNATVALPCVVLIGLAMPVLAMTYSANPKERPVDLRSAYAYLRAQAGTNDVILGVGEPKWSSTFFHFTDAYSLRPQTGAGSLRVIPVRAAPPPPLPGSFPFKKIDSATGKLFALIVVNQNAEPSVARFAGDAYTVACWQQVCVIESRLNAAMPQRLDDFLGRFAFLDPPEFAALWQYHRGGAAEAGASAGRR